jgi:hypothetical protein
MFWDDPKIFLVEFGYLNEEKASDVNAMRDAIASAQRFYNLPSTGILDEASKRAMLGARRCGCTDMQLARDAMNKWGKTDLTYSIERRPTGLDMTPEGFDAAVENSFAVWSAVCPLRFTRVESDQANIVLSTGRGPRARFDGPGGTLAYAFLPPEPGFIGQLLMVIDLDDPFTLDPNQSAGVYMPAVLQHEMGHLWALEHTTTPGQLMQPVYNPRILTPQWEDIQRVQALYGKGVSPTPTPVPTVPSPAGRASQVEVQIRLNGDNNQVWVGSLSKRA